MIPHFRATSRRGLSGFEKMRLRLADCLGSDLLVELGALAATASREPSLVVIVVVVVGASQTVRRQPA